MFGLKTASSATPESDPSPSPLLKYCHLISLVLATSLTVVFASRPDSLAGMTVFPIWCWTLGPLLITLLLQLIYRRGCWMLWAVWLGVTLWFFDSPLAIPKMIYQAGPGPTREASPHSIRIITINCHDQREAISDLAKFDPDVVMVQETFGKAELQKQADELFGQVANVIWDRDVAIISRFPMQEFALDSKLRTRAIAGVITLANGPQEAATEFLITSVHLSSQPFRLDMWRPEFWNDFFEARTVQREQMKNIVKALHKRDKTQPFLIGGDFNACAGDAVYFHMPSDLEDTFPRCGVGWGRTITNGFPLLRIDQLWSNEKLTPVTAKAFPTKGSDHRGVVADYLWHPPESSDRTEK